MVENRSLSVIFTQEFKVLRPLGIGGRSYVYQVKEWSTGKEYALKVIEKSRLTDKNWSKQIANEINIQSQLDNLNITKLYEHFEDSENIYLLIELCLGGELYAYIKAEGRLGESEARLLCRQLVNAVKYLHGQKILHRDLKLSNILLTEDRTIKIADFGLAVQLDCQAGDCDTVCGTPNYLAPEVFNKQKYGLQADLWSLGCIIYGCLVGVPPFESLNLKTTFKKAQQLNYNFPDYLSAEAVDLIQNLLVLNPKKRLTIDQVIQHDFFVKDDAELSIQKDWSFYEYQEIIPSLHPFPINKENLVPNCCQQQQSYKVIPIDTRNLRPFRHLLQGGGDIEIEEGGWVKVRVNNRCLELRGGAIIYQNKPYSISTIPRSGRNLYQYARQVLQVILGNTPQIVIEETDAKFILMSNMPNPNFKAMLVDGINIEYKLKDSQIKIQTDKDEVLLNIASDLEELDDCLQKAVKLAMNGLRKCLSHINYNY